MNSRRSAAITPASVGLDLTQARASRPPVNLLSQLSDVAIASPAHNQAIAYDGATGKWRNASNEVSGVTILSVGQSYVDVVFPGAQPSVNWAFVECRVVNTVDPEPLNLFPGIVTAKSVTGFRVLLNGTPDSSNYQLFWTIRPLLVASNTYTLSGPSGGNVGVPSTSFTVSLPAGGFLAAPVTITPNDGGGGGAFTPASVMLSTDSPSATFSYTPASSGAKTISTTNSGTLTDPAALTYTAMPPATTYTLTGPSSGPTSVASSNFTVALPAGTSLAAPVTITPNDGGGGGGFTPTSVILSAASPSATFTYTPASSGAKTISTTNSGTLTNPAALTYTAIPLATTYTLTGPSSGPKDVASANFTVQLPGGTTLAAPVTITPSDGGGGGAFTPTSVILSAAAPSATFTYTPASYGAKTISTTNSGTLTNPASLTYTSIATTYSFTGPSGGTELVASTPFTVALPSGGVLLAPVTITPHDGGAGGTFTPTTVNLSTGTPSQTFTYTPPVGAATRVLSVTNSGTLTNPANLNYAVTGSPHLLTGLVSYWKLDEGSGSVTAGTTFADSNAGGNTGTQNGTGFSGAAKLNNGQFNSASGGVFIEIPSATNLKPTGDFTWSAWARFDSTGDNCVLAKGDNGLGGAAEYLLMSLGSGGYGLAFNAGGVSTASPGSVPTTGVWYHLVGWWDSATNKANLRVNDTTTYVSSTSGTLAMGNSVLRFEQYKNGAGALYPLNGGVDEIGFWNRKLTAAEITLLYGSGTPPPYSSFT